MALTSACLALLSSSLAFHLSAPPSTVRRRCSAAEMVVHDITSTADLDEALSAAGDTIVVVEYSTSTCEPCRAFAPGYERISNTYEDIAIFYKVLGDATSEAEQLMAAQDIKSVPFFQFWRGSTLRSTLCKGKLSTMDLVDKLEELRY